MKNKTPSLSYKTSLSICLLFFSLIVNAQQPPPFFIPTLPDYCTLNPSTPTCQDDPTDNPTENNLPDLKIIDITAVLRNDNDFEEGCVFEITVENIGTSPVSSSFDFDLFLNQNTAPLIGELSDYFVSHSSPIPAGTTAKIQMDIPWEVIPGSGEIRNISGLVDSTRQISELIEGNNHYFQCAITVISPICRPSQ